MDSLGELKLDATFGKKYEQPSLNSKLLSAECSQSEILATKEQALLLHQPIPTLQINNKPQILKTYVSSSSSENRSEKIRQFGRFTENY